MTRCDATAGNLPITRLPLFLFALCAMVTVTTLPAAAQAHGGAVGGGSQKSSSPTGNASAAANVGANTAAGGLNPLVSFDGSYDPVDAARAQRLMAHFAADQVKKNAADADKLLQLTRSLSAAVIAPSTTASAAVSKQLDLATLKQLDQIEKLAKRLRERMATPIPFPSPDPMHTTN